VERPLPVEYGALGLLERRQADPQRYARVIDAHVHGALEESCVMAQRVGDRHPVVQLGHGAWLGEAQDHCGNLS